MKHTLNLILLIISLAFLYSSCGDDPFKGDGGNNNSVDTNILRTDAFCNILGGDTADWCIDTTGTFSFGPACPNPSLTTTVRFYLPQDDTVRLTMKNSLGGSDTVLFDGPLTAGTHARDINGANFINTFQRVCITSKRYSPGAGCNFCGDVKFEQ